METGVSGSQGESLFGLLPVLVLEVWSSMVIIVLYELSQEKILNFQIFIHDFSLFSICNLYLIKHIFNNLFDYNFPSH